MLAIQICQREAKSTSFKGKGERSLLHKEKNCMLRLLGSTVRINIQFLKLWRRKKEIHASFSVSPQIAKVIPPSVISSLFHWERHYIKKNKVFYFIY